jgi:hypothetical protein
MDLNNENVVDAVIAIANERKNLLLEMREAVRKHDLESVFVYAAQLVGEREPASNEEKRN